MMMPTLPPVPSQEARDTVAALLAIIRNPDEAQKHLNLIKESSEALSKYHGEVKEEQDRLAHSKAALAQERQEFARARERIEPARIEHNKRVMEVTARAEALNRMEADLRRRQESFEHTKSEWVESQRRHSIEMEQGRNELQRTLTQTAEANRLAEKKRQEYDDRVAGLKKILST